MVRSTLEIFSTKCLIQLNFCLQNTIGRDHEDHLSLLDIVHVFRNKILRAQFVSLFIKLTSNENIYLKEDR